MDPKNVNLQYTENILAIIIALQYSKGYGVLGKKSQIKSIFGIRQWTNLLDYLLSYMFQEVQRLRRLSKILRKVSI